MHFHQRPRACPRSATKRTASGPTSARRNLRGAVAPRKPPQLGGLFGRCALKRAAEQLAQHLALVWRERPEHLVLEDSIARSAR